MTSTTPQNAPFGSILTDVMAIATYKDGHWGAHSLRAVGPIEIHPAAHALHYGSECFEGFKAYKWADDTVHVFRMDRHIERLRQSARSLVLPEPDAAQVAEMVTAVVDRCRAAVPDAPGALYLRPLLFGTMPNIGAASMPTSEACLIVLASPVLDYFAGGARPLRIYIEEQATRCASHLGVVKTGGNYAAALPDDLCRREPFPQANESAAVLFVVSLDAPLATKSECGCFVRCRISVDRRGWHSELRGTPRLGN